MSRNDGGPAFPVSTRQCESDPGYGHQDSASTWQFGGMSLRDWFAGQAMVGILQRGMGNTLAEVTTFSFELADAMLAAREGKR